MDSNLWNAGFSNILKIRTLENRVSLWTCEYVSMKWSFVQHVRNLNSILDSKQQKDQLRSQTNTIKHIFKIDCWTNTRRCSMPRWSLDDPRIRFFSLAQIKERHCFVISHHFDNQFSHGTSQVGVCVNITSYCTYLCWIWIYVVS